MVFPFTDTVVSVVNCTHSALPLPPCLLRLTDIWHLHFNFLGLGSGERLARGCTLDTPNTMRSQF